MRDKSGREVYACEIGAEGCKHTGCKARPCPYGYCQRYYVCGACWLKPEVKALFTREGGKHEACRISAEAYEIKETEKAQLLAAGKFLRVAALAQEGDTVHVIFRNGSGDEIGRYMPAAVYQAFGYSTNTTVEDYEAEAMKRGAAAILSAPAEFAPCST